MSHAEVYTIAEHAPSKHETTVLVTLRGELLARLRDYASDYHDGDLEHALDALFRDTILAACGVLA